MKTYIRYTLLTAITLSLGAGQLSAGDDEAWAAIGGFVAGVITGTIIDDDHHYHVERSVRYEPRRGHGYRRTPDPVRYGGHWEMRKVRIWVPGYWEISHSRCGDRIRIWKSGHYTWKKNRVWVPHPKKGDHHRDRG